MTAEALLVTALGLPIVASILVLLFGPRPNVREGAAIMTGLSLAFVVIRMATRFDAGEEFAVHAVSIMPGLDIAFRVERLGLVFACVAAVLWPVTTLYAAGYMRGHHEENQTRFFAFFPLAIFAAIGAAFSGNLLTLFFFYELMTLATYPLVTHHGTDKARNGGRIYLGILIFTSVAFFLFAIIWTYQATGTLDFRLGGILQRSDGQGELVPILPDFRLGLLLGLFVFGIGKAALMPFHRWLPAAMVAPTPVSALLHAVAVVKVGVFSVLKVSLFIFGIDLLRDTGVSFWLACIAGISLVWASLIAMRQDNLKARLAYSTVSQLAYIVLGAMLATPSATLGGALHIVTHAVGKITLFFCAGAIYVAAHKTEISDMKGLGRRMPVTFFAFTIASLSVIGLPPLGGTWSKWFLCLGSAEAEAWPLLGALMLSTLLNIAYLMPIAWEGFFGESSDEERIKEAPVACLIPIVMTTVGCLILFFCCGPIVEFLEPLVRREAL